VSDLAGVPYEYCLAVAHSPPSRQYIKVGPRGQILCLAEKQGKTTETDKFHPKAQNKNA